MDAAEIASRAEALLSSLRSNVPPSKASVVELARALANPGSATSASSSSVARLAASLSADLAAHNKPRIFPPSASQPLLSALASSRGCRTAASSLAYRRLLGLQPTRSSLLSVLSACATERNSTAAKTAFFSVENAPRSPRGAEIEGNIINQTTRRRFIQTLLQCNDSQAALSYIQMLPSSEKTPFPESSYIAVSHACADSGNADGALAVLPADSSRPSAHLARAKAYALKGSRAQAAAYLSSEADGEQLVQWVQERLNESVLSSHADQLRQSLTYLQKVGSIREDVEVDEVIPNKAEAESDSGEGE
jgi:hypothetical protein